MQICVAINKFKMKVFTILGEKLNYFGMISPRQAEENNFGDEIAQELGYDCIATSCNTINPSFNSKTKSRFHSSVK